MSVFVNMTNQASIFSIPAVKKIVSLATDAKNSMLDRKRKEDHASEIDLLGTFPPDHGGKREGLENQTRNSAAINNM